MIGEALTSKNKHSVEKVTKHIIEIYNKLKTPFYLNLKESRDFGLTTTNLKKVQKSLFKENFILINVKEVVFVTTKTDFFKDGGIILDKDVNPLNIFVDPLNFYSKNIIKDRSFSFRIGTRANLSLYKKSGGGERWGVINNFLRSFIICKVKVYWCSPLPHHGDIIVEFLEKKNMLFAE